jgi:hypothetical protein
MFFFFLCVLDSFLFLFPFNNSKGIHKLFHKLAVKHCKAAKCTKIYAVALTTSFRKPSKQYRFQDVCKALWSGPDAMVVVRDLNLENK